MYVNLLSIYPVSLPAKYINVQVVKLFPFFLHKRQHITCLFFTWPVNSVVYLGDLSMSAHGMHPFSFFMGNVLPSLYGTVWGCISYLLLHNELFHTVKASNSNGFIYSQFYG